MFHNTVPGSVLVMRDSAEGFFIPTFRYTDVTRTGPLQLTEMWKYALIGGLLAVPFTALEAWRSPENVALGTVVLGSVLAGYLVRRRGGNSTATGLRAALIGGVPLLWALGNLLWSVPGIPNPLWFQAVSVGAVVTFGACVFAVVALLGALAGRFGGWLAERRGHTGTANPGQSV